MKDEEIQEWLDKKRGTPADFPEDANNYKLLYEELNNLEENTSLAPGFAHRVTANLAKTEVRDRKLYLILVMAGAVTILLALIMLAIFSGIPSISISGTGMNLFLFVLIALMLSLGYHFLERKSVEGFRK